MSAFIFESFHFDKATNEASFHYTYDDGRRFVETMRFEADETYDEVALERALRLAHLIVGVSYVKTFPIPQVEIATGDIDEWTANFLNSVYQEGLGQFAFENDLTRESLPHFVGTATAALEPVSYQGEGVLSLQSGGKDSLLVATLLKNNGQSFTPWYVTTGDEHPGILDQLGEKLSIAKRTIDIDALKAAANEGGRNGHVPVTYILQSYAIIQTILLNKSDVLVAVAHEGEEPHAWIGDLAVTHQWSKTWQAEQQFAEYVRRYIAPTIRIGSPLRGMSELKVAELFVQHCWQDYGHTFSSCNRANYMQGAQNGQLTWCGECPKCANSYLLFAPFVPAEELKSLFNGQDLFEKPLLQETFKGLLGIDGVMKPFECIGEIDELRYAYHQAQEKGEYGQLSFTVPIASFNPDTTFPSQDWARL